MLKTRTAIASALAAGLLILPLTATTAAHAADPVEVLLFSNALYTDAGEEDLEMLGAIQATGSNVTVFDGGDGSVAAWTAALTDRDVLVIPEQENDSILNGALDTALAAYLRSWVSAGGHLVFGYFAGNLDVVDAIVGEGYDGLGSYSSGPYTLVTGAALPAQLQLANATDGIDFSGFTPQQLAVFSPVYTEGPTAVVAEVALGAGTVVLLGYDWFPDASDIASGIRADWDTVLGFYVLQASEPAAVDPVAPPAAPQLASTGAEAAPLIIFAAVLMLVGAGVVTAARMTARHA